MQPHAFTAAEDEGAAEAVHLARAHANDPSRPEVAGTAIDSETTQDRDDAIAFYMQDGRLVVDVSIADVAAAIPAASPLDLAARAMGFTRYRPDRRDPMLPFSLSEDALTLTGDAMRPALTVRLFLNPDTGRVEGTRFMPSRIRAGVISYDDFAGATRREEEPAATWNRIGEWLAVTRHGGGALPIYDMDGERIVDEEGNAISVRRHQIGAYRLVQETMLLANQALSEWAAEAGIPFLFRNHGAHFRGRYDTGESFFRRDDAATAAVAKGFRAEDTPGRVEMGRAAYESFSRGHYGLDAPAYGHNTSPIRRYADLANQRMLHYAFGQIHTMLRWAVAANPAEETRLTDELWSRSAELLRLVEQSRASSAAAGTLVRKLKAYLPASGGAGSAEWLVDELHAHHPPYTHADMQALAGHLNERMQQDRAERKEQADSELARWLVKVFPDTDPVKIRNFVNGSFSKLLRGAAENGLMSDVFFKDVIDRMQSGELAFPDDYAVILARVADRGDDRWAQLQDAILARLKQAPVMEKRVYDRVLELEQMPASVIEGSLRQRDGRVFAAAAVVAEGEDGAVASRYFSVAASPETARQQAMRQFLTDLAHGELQPAENVAFPPLLNLQLPHCAESLRALWERVVAEAALEVTVDARRKNGTHILSKLVQGPELPVPVMVEGRGRTPEAASAAAIASALRHPALQGLSAVRTHLPDVEVDGPGHDGASILDAEGGAEVIRPRPHAERASASRAAPADFQR